MKCVYFDFFLRVAHDVDGSRSGGPRTSPDDPMSDLRGLDTTTELSPVSGLRRGGHGAGHGHSKHPWRLPAVGHHGDSSKVSHYIPSGELNIIQYLTITNIHSVVILKL